MIGAIIGDIVGSRYEFDATNDYGFEMFGDGCDFTDDTICTVAVADALLRNRDYGESIHEWCQRFPNPKGGYGGRFRQWVMSDTPCAYGSFGNGSAMRVCPVGWWFDEIADVRKEAAKTAECTHNHPEGIKGAVAVAEAIYGCRMLRELIGERNLTANNIHKVALGRAIREYVDNPEEFEIDLERYRNQFDETCQGTVPVALWIVMHSAGFEDALRMAVSLGADADTLGAIVGSIAEALWGVPEWMENKALSYLPEDMKNVVADFTKKKKVTYKM